MPTDHTLNRRMLDLAARAALRGAGDVEPNPMVGCVIGDDDGTIRGVGHHRRFGGAHAEVEALRSCRANGRDARGATAWVTLEPCSHFGKTPPCTQALIEAGVRRVVIARVDPHPISTGGVEMLRDAGIEVDISAASAAAIELSSPFVTRIEKRRPFVTLKWAQTLDGRIATRTGHSQWISGARSRRRVHRMRAVSDVILTGVGTVLADDPLLTARGVPVRRMTKRVVIDSQLRTPLDSKLVRSVEQGPVWVVSTTRMADSERADALERLGVELLFVPAKDDGGGGNGGETGGGNGGGKVDLHEAIEFFAAMSQLEDFEEQDNATNILVEAGPGLAGALWRDGLVDRCVVFVAPMLLGDGSAPGPAQTGSPAMIGEAHRLELLDQRRCGVDTMLTYKVRHEGA